VFLSVKETRRRKKFSDSLPETLQLMAGSLSAGYSLPQACDSVVREGQDPVATEFNRALVETRLGVPIEDALETIADRMRSKDWAWVVMAIRVQREVGGNLAELLITVASTLRDRARIRRQIQTLSAEGRLSAWILGGLPIVFTLYLLVARPSYILTLTKEPLGWLMIAGGVIFMVIGGLWMKKIVDVEV
jgi:tight adherence protein B